MILSNVELFKALDEERLIIDPEPTPRFKAQGRCPFDTHSVDLRLSDEITIPQAGSYAYDLSQPGQLADHISKNSNKVRISGDQPYLLKPNRFILGMTYERIALPIDPECEICLAARIEGKSSCARCGLQVHFTAPTVHPNWDGWLVLEMINLGPVPILLTPGMYIAQLIVEEVKGCPVENPSQFHGQRHPNGTH